MFAFFNCRRLTFDESLNQYAKDQNFHLDGYRFEAASEQLRSPRIVKVAAIQNQIVEPTDSPVEKQRDAIHKRVTQLIEAAARAGANIICMQECWTMPFSFCTRERLPWVELAESAENGPTTKLLSEVCLINACIFSDLVGKKAQLCHNFSNSRA